MNMRSYRKKNFPVAKIRRFLEPGPVVLVSSAWKNQRSIMTMGWHLVMETEPALVGCYLWTVDYSRELILKSRECVINIPTADMAETIVKIGNTSGRDIDKFSTFGLTADKASQVAAPLIRECFANFECRLIDTSWVKKRSFFLFKVVKAHVARSPDLPKTLHYRGEGRFMISGPTVSYRKWFKPEMLKN